MGESLLDLHKNCIYLTSSLLSSVEELCSDLCKTGEIHDNVRLPQQRIAALEYLVNFYYTYNERLTQLSLKLSQSQIEMYIKTEASDSDHEQTQVQQNKQAKKRGRKSKSVAAQQTTSAGIKYEGSDDGSETEDCNDFYESDTQSDDIADQNEVAGHNESVSFEVKGDENETVLAQMKVDVCDGDNIDNISDSVHEHNTPSINIKSVGGGVWETAAPSTSSGKKAKGAKKRKVAQERVKPNRNEDSSSAKSTEQGNKETKVPNNKTKVPNKQTEVPNKETKVPNEEAKVPKRETIVPNKETKVPNKETEVPNKETKIPNKETKVPNKETKIPKGNNKKNTKKKRKKYVYDYHCEECEFISHRLYQLKRHVAHKHRGRDSKTLMCSFCGKFFSVYSLDKHIKTVHNHDKFICKCHGKVYQTEAGLRHHEETILRFGDENKRYTCSFCSRQFSKKQEFLDHENGHRVATAMAAKIK